MNCCRNNHTTSADESGDDGAPDESSHLSIIESSGPCSANQTGDVLSHREVLLNLLPEEVWMEVLQKLDNTAKERASNATEFFRTLLKPLRPIYLFPSVWKIVAFKLEQRLREEFQRSTSPGHYLTLMNIPWNLRLVCKSWCNGVDTLYETFNYTHMVNNEYIFFCRHDEDDRMEDWNYSPRHSPWYATKTTRFLEGNGEMRSDMEPFVRNFGENCYDRNPFVGRRVKLQPVGLPWDSYEEACRVFHRVTPFLEMFGSHIWYCTIESGSCWIDFDEDITTTLKWMELMPNLRVLVWNWEHGKVPPENDSTIYPIPRLSSLKAVTLSNVPFKIAKQFMQHNCDLLSCNIHQYENIFTILDLGLSCRHLTHLHINVNHTSFEQLEVCTERWNLEKIVLSFELHASEYIPWERVFRTLERWRNTLTNVVLKMPVAKNKKDALKLLKATSLRLDLPKLIRLRVTIPMLYLMKHFMSLQKSMELLEVERFDCWKFKEQYASTVITNQHLREEGIFDLYTENDISYETFWKLFPNLRRIDYQPSLNASPTNYMRNVASGKNFYSGM